MNTTRTFKGNKNVKYKKTPNGNVKITMTEEEAMAMRDFIGWTSSMGRIDLVKKHGMFWSPERDKYLGNIHLLITNNI